MWLLLALIAVPLLEIAAFIMVGGEIGVAATLLLVLLTAMAGAMMLRYQGVAVLTRIRTELQADRVPARELAHGAMITVAAILLLVPGFITDMIGLLLFVPGVRNFLWRQAMKRARVYVARRRPSASGPRPVLDLDEGEFDSRPTSASPWRLGRDRS
jgi:UPF0716 protein FxsA